MSEPTQVRHPWRAAARTGFAFLIGVASLWPTITLAGHLGTGPVLGQVGAVALAITRIMAVPGVNDLLTTIGLGATPKR